METYQFKDNTGKILDVTFAIDLVEATEFAVDNDLVPCNIVNLGPTSISAWADWLKLA